MFATGLLTQARQNEDAGADTDVDADADADEPAYRREILQVFEAHPVIHGLASFGGLFKRRHGREIKLKKLGFKLKKLLSTFPEIEQEKTPGGGQVTYSLRSAAAADGEKKESGGSTFRVSRRCMHSRSRYEGRDIYNFTGFFLSP